ncbi:class I SAM-dependent methyltransferase [Desulfurobacterium atlanticum]|uniref:Putative SAM-dependent methyltransferase n=1 Tax=Desulfurobacterium atlanticum TaxID=240169 RepID=A0A238XMA3_9BACT|nr:class I SAM-dependent methyltransferase [Desulfurobacterium atlanticum]SNR59812.1 Putative SAM-dependent methyltransferase [Desulfurobacterium atlanticum]
MEVVVTTEKSPAKDIIEDARQLAKKFNAEYVYRRHSTIESIKKRYKKNVLVVSRDGLILHTLTGSKLFFHPGLVKIRLLNYIQTGKEAMVEAMNLKKGDRVLDCNLGLAQDAVICAFVTGEKVVGVEKNPVIAEIVSRGLKSFKPKGKLKVAEDAFRRIEVNVGDNSEFLKSLPDNAFDIVYFSPMFIKPKWKCDVMQPFREVAVKDFIAPETLKEAERVARKRVVIKVNKGVKEMFPFLESYTLQKSATNVEYLYKDV